MVTYKIRLQMTTGVMEIDDVIDFTCSYNYFYLTRSDKSPHCIDLNSILHAYRKRHSERDYKTILLKKPKKGKTINVEE